METDELIRSLRDYYGSYHHHKEQMAYGATVIYLTAATFVILNGHAIKASFVPWGIVIVMLILAWLFTFVYVMWQLIKRKVAAEIIEACTTLLTRRVAEPEGTSEAKLECYKGLDLPKVLVDTLRLKNENRKLRYSPVVSELLTYLAIILWSVLAGLSIWLSHLNDQPSTLMGF